MMRSGGLEAKQTPTRPENYIFFSDEKMFRFGQFYFTEQAGDDKATPTVNSGL